MDATNDCHHWNKQRVPFVLQERWGRDQIRVSSPEARPHTAPSRLPRCGLFPITIEPGLPCHQSAAWAAQAILDRGMFYPSWLSCYHTQCLFFFIEKCKLCACKCWKLRIFHLFVERQTGWHNFNQTLRCSLACPWGVRGGAVNNNTECFSS